MGPRSPSVARDVEHLARARILRREPVRGDLEHVQAAVRGGGDVDHRGEVPRLHPRRARAAHPVDVGAARREREAGQLTDVDAPRGPRARRRSGRAGRGSCVPAGWLRNGGASVWPNGNTARRPHRPRGRHDRAGRCRRRPSRGSGRRARRRRRTGWSRLRPSAGRGRGCWPPRRRRGRRRAGRARLRPCGRGPRSARPTRRAQAPARIGAEADGEVGGLPRKETSCGPVALPHPSRPASRGRAAARPPAACGPSPRRRG